MQHTLSKQLSLWLDLKPGPVRHYVTWTLPDQWGVKDGSLLLPLSPLLSEGVSTTMAQPCIVWDSTDTKASLYMSPEEFLSSRSFPGCTLPRLSSAPLSHTHTHHPLISVAPSHPTLETTSSKLLTCCSWWSFSSLCSGFTFNFRICNHTVCWPLVLVICLLSHCNYKAWVEIEDAVLI